MITENWLIAFRVPKPVSYATCRSAPFISRRTRTVKRLCQMRTGTTPPCRYSLPVPSLVCQPLPSLPLLTSLKLGFRFIIIVITHPIDYLVCYLINQYATGVLFPYVFIPSFGIDSKMLLNQVIRFIQQHKTFFDVVHRYVPS